MRGTEKYIDWLHFSSLIAQAMASGSIPEHTKCHWDISNGCHKPFRVTLCSHPHDQPWTATQTIDTAKQRWLDIDTPCRKCETCLKARQRLWISRMKSEINQSNRTWFCTYTINPHHRFMFSLQSGSSNYTESYKIISKEFTKYLKRLRKAGYKFKYVLVAENHKDGYPHLHAFVHEVSTPIPKRALQGQWPYGFTQVKLVDLDHSNAAYYAAKYLAKDARTRIRASQQYGRSVRDLSLENPLPKQIGFHKVKLRDTLTPPITNIQLEWLYSQIKDRENVDQTSFQTQSEWPSDPFAIPWPNIGSQTFSG